MKHGTFKQAALIHVKLTTTTAVENTLEIDELQHLNILQNYVYAKPVTGTYIAIVYRNISCYFSRIFDSEIKLSFSSHEEPVCIYISNILLTL